MGTVYKIRVLTSENSTDTFSDKYFRNMISREVLTKKADDDKIELPQNESVAGREFRHEQNQTDN